MTLTSTCIVRSWQPQHSPLVFGVDVGAVVEQVLDHRHAVVTGRKVQRGGVTALQVPAVHVLGRAELLPERDNMAVRDQLGDLTGEGRNAGSTPAALTARR